MPHTSACCVWGLSARFVINTNPKWGTQETYWFSSQEINECLTVTLLLLIEREFQRKIILCVLLSRFSCVRLCCHTVSQQAPLSMGFSKARILEWVTFPFSRGSSWPRDQTCTISCIFCITGRFFNTEPPGQTNCVFSSVQFSSVAQLCPTLCDPMNYSTPGLPVHHQPPEFT